MPLMNANHPSCSDGFQEVVLDKMRFLKFRLWHLIWQKFRAAICRHDEPEILLLGLCRQQRLFHLVHTR